MDSIMTIAHNASMTAKLTNRRADHLEAEKACRYVVQCSWRKQDRVNFGYLAEFHASEAALLST